MNYCFFISFKSLEKVAHMYVCVFWDGYFFVTMLSVALYQHSYFVELILLEFFALNPLAWLEEQMSISWTAAEWCLMNLEAINRSLLHFLLIWLTKQVCSLPLLHSLADSVPFHDFGTLIISYDSQLIIFIFLHYHFTECIMFK